MGKISNIEWCTATWNPWEGCKKVSPGCRGCYAERQFNWLGKDFSQVNRTSDKTFYAPLMWKRPELIFCNSISDFFIEEADSWRPAAWQVIKNTPHHFYQILTKRTERIKDHLPEDWGETGYPNVIIGTSVENQKEAEKRIPLLMQSGPGWKFLSIEPLLGPVDLSFSTWRVNNGTWSAPFLQYAKQLDWVIIGGESGFSKGKFKYRPCEVNWMKSIVNECKTAGVPVFVKQMGTHISKELQMRWADGKRDTHGHNFDAFPPALQYRQFPAPIRAFLDNREAWIEKEKNRKKTTWINPKTLERHEI